MRRWLKAVVDWLCGSTQPTPAAPPRPSDILAGLVAARMIVSPERVKLARRHGYEVFTWQDEDKGLFVEAETHSGYSLVSKLGRVKRFTYRERDLCPSAKASMELRQAMVRCLLLAHEKRRAKRQYEGDMAALDAVQEIFTTEDEEQAA